MYFKHTVTTRSRIICKPLTQGMWLSHVLPTRLIILLSVSDNLTIPWLQCLYDLEQTIFWVLKKTFCSLHMYVTEYTFCCSMCWTLSCFLDHNIYVVPSCLIGALLSACTWCLTVSVTFTRTSQRTHFVSVIKPVCFAYSTFTRNTATLVTTAINMTHWHQGYCVRQIVMLVPNYCICNYG
jgi:hypothetical protein